MSTHVDNPFAPPTPGDENPFEAVPLTGTNGTNGTNDVLEKQRGVPSVSASNGSIPPDAGTVQARERELLRREARIAREETDLRRREALSVTQNSDPSSRPKNWPSFFKVLRYDLTDFPPLNAPLVRVAHYTWCVAAVAYVWNAFVITCAFFGGVAAIGAGDWLVALAFAGGGVPLSRWGWYGALVGVARRSGSRSIAQTAAYGRFFTHFGIHCLAVVFALVSVPVLGTFCAGFFFLIAAFGDSAFVGFLGVVNVGLWGLTLVGSLVVGKRALEKFRDAGDGDGV